MSWTASEFVIQQADDFMDVVVHDQVVADLNGDGRPDVLTAYRWNPERFPAIPVSVAINQGDGTFVDGTANLFGGNITGTEHPSGIWVDDYNGDARPDVFIYDVGPEIQPTFPYGLNRLILSNGAHGLIDASDRLVDVREYNHGAASGDFDRDGDVDLFVATADPFAFLLNDGDGNFTPTGGLLPWDNITPSEEHAFTGALFFDANKDGWLDLFLGRWSYITTTKSLLLINDHSGNFAHVDPIVVPEAAPSAYVWQARAADFNGDGFDDLVMSTGVLPDFGPLLQILINDGEGHFTDETALRLPWSAVHGNRAFTSDINGDGYIDLYITDALVGLPPPFLLNDGTGHFVELPRAFMPYHGGQLTVADINGDGRQDVLLAPLTIIGDVKYQVLLASDPGENPTGTGEEDGLLGDQSNETISGLGGSDVVFGGSGNDILRGGAGKDYLNGGAGSDTADFSDKTVAVTATLAEGTVRATVRVGGVDEDTIQFIENVKGGSADDVLTGNTLANSLKGGASADNLVGGAGDDTLGGGSGDDMLTGEAGADTFLFDTNLSKKNVVKKLDKMSNLDHIMDFSVGEDRIELDKSIFTKLSVGAMKKKEFFKGNDIGDAGKKVLIAYDKGSGELAYVAGKKDIVFAILNDSPDELSHKDFDIVA